jgi:hypothetical protein
MSRDLCMRKRMKMDCPLYNVFYPLWMVIVTL